MEIGALMIECCSFHCFCCDAVALLPERWGVLSMLSMTSVNVWDVN